MTIAVNNKSVTVARGGNVRAQMPTNIERKKKLGQAAADVKLKKPVVAGDASVALPNGRKLQVQLKKNNRNVRGLLNSEKLKDDSINVSLKDPKNSELLLKLNVDKNGKLKTINGSKVSLETSLGKNQSLTSSMTLKDKSVNFEHKVALPNGTTFNAGIDSTGKASGGVTFKRNSDNSLEIGLGPAGAKVNIAEKDFRLELNASSKEKSAELQYKKTF